MFDVGFFFFFQAEDGIRDVAVTGVQTCALPILAERLGGEVVACDSTQLYRGFDIGTAKPRAAERRGVAHHFMDLLDPGEAATSGGYRGRAFAGPPGFGGGETFAVFYPGERILFCAA